MPWEVIASCAVATEVAELSKRDLCGIELTLHLVYLARVARREAVYQQRNKAEVRSTCPYIYISLAHPRQLQKLS